MAEQLKILWYANNNPCGVVCHNTTSSLAKSDGPGCFSIHRTEKHRGSLPLTSEDECYKWSLKPDYIYKSLIML